MGNKISDIFHRMTEWLSGLRSIFSGNWVKPAVILSACVIFVVGSFMVWTNVLSPEARKSREDGEKIAEFFSGLQAAEERQRQDTYGGETPEETLQLFIAALENDDLELASKYFKLDDLGYSDPRILENLKKTKEEGKMMDIISMLKIAEPVDGWGPYYGFEIRDEKGELIHGIGLFKGEHYSVWKIESL